HADFTPDGRTLVAFSADHTVHVWDVSTGTKVRRFSLMQEAPRLPTPRAGWGLLYEAVLSADGRWVAYGSPNRYIALFDVATGRREFEAASRGPLSAADLDAAWAALTGEDATRAGRAIQKLVASPQVAVTYIGHRLQPVRPAEERQVTRLLADLDSDHFATR